MRSEPRRLDWPGVRSSLRRSGFTLPTDARPFWFGDDPQMAHDLGMLVRRGTKTATAGLADAWRSEANGLPRTGQIFVVLDWEGDPLGVIRNTAVDVIPFEDVGAEFAVAEGEGDGSLEWWREAHWKYFSRECQDLGVEPDVRMLVVCQRFEVLWPRDGRTRDVAR